jgi:hypothetical protein
MPEVLKMFQLSQQDGVAEMKVRGGGIEARLNSKRLASGARLFQLLAQLRLLHNFRGAFLYVCQLFVNRREGRHGYEL